MSAEGNRGTAVLQVWAELEEPVAVPAWRGDGNFIPTLTYVQGSVFRGAVAAMLLRAGKENSKLFREGIAGGRLQFSALTPAGALPPPRSSYTCKYFPGFAGGEGGSHGVQDVLVLTAVQWLEGRASGQGSLPGVPLISCTNGGDREPCGAVMQPLEGLWTLPLDELEGAPRSGSVDRRVSAHVAIAPSFDAARGGAFYALEALHPRSRSGEAALQGEVRGPEHLLEALADALRELRSKPGITLKLGADRTRGHGGAVLHMDPSEAWSDERLAARVSDLQQAMERGLARGRAAGATDGLPPESNSVRHLAVCFLSPAILLDDWLSPRWEPELADLLDDSAREEYGSLLAGFRSTPVRFAAPTRIEGWHSAAGLFKTTDAALDAGSVLYFHSEQGVALERLLPALEHLEREGAGWRRAEGFGRLIVCHPWHVAYAAGDAGGSP
jgi:CRISPR-associated Csx10 family RAMP protein